MLLVFQMFFPTPVISRIESVLRGWGLGGRRGQVGSRRHAKATIQTQRAVLCLQSVTQTVTMHKGGQNWQEEQPGTPCSPIDAPQGHEMHPCGFIASIKSRFEACLRCCVIDVHITKTFHVIKINEISVSLRFLVV